MEQDKETGFELFALLASAVIAGMAIGIQIAGSVYHCARVV